MKKLITYYVVDPIMESIVGSFSAPSFDAAKSIFKKSVLENEKMKVYDNSLKVFTDEVPLEIPETFSEVVDYGFEVNLYE